jgi:hypothetical protein
MIVVSSSLSIIQPRKIRKYNERKTKLFQILTITSISFAICSYSFILLVLKLRILIRFTLISNLLALFHIHVCLSIIMISLVNHFLAIYYFIVSFYLFITILLQCCDCKMAIFYTYMWLLMTTNVSSCYFCSSFALRFFN